MNVITVFKLTYDIVESKFKFTEHTYENKGIDEYSNLISTDNGLYKIETPEYKKFDMQVTYAVEGEVNESMREIVKHKVYAAMGKKIIEKQSFYNDMFMSYSAFVNSDA